MDSVAGNIALRSIAGDIDITTSSTDSKVLVDLRDPSNSFEISSTDTSQGPSVTECHFAVHGDGATQMSIETIDLLPEFGVIDSVPNRRITIINGGESNGGNYTLALADGVRGQVKTFSIGTPSAVAANVVITPATAAFATASLDVATSGSCVTLAYTTEWNAISGTAAVANHAIV
jgi:hypothetical protein